MIDVLQQLGDLPPTREAELPFFAAVSFYNLALAQYQHADYASAAVSSGGGL